MSAVKLSISVDHALLAAAKAAVGNSPHIGDSHLVQFALLALVAAYPEPPKHTPCTCPACLMTQEVN